MLLLFSCWVMSNSLPPHELQHAWLPCPSPSPRVCSNSCPLSQWYYLTISPSAAPFSSCPQIFSSIRVFFNKSALCIRWPKYWSFSISPSNEFSGLISFMIDWFDLLDVQGTVKSLLQHHSSLGVVLQHKSVLTHWFDWSEYSISLAPVTGPSIITWFRSDYPRCFGWNHCMQVWGHPAMPMPLWSGRCVRRKISRSDGWREIELLNLAVYTAHWNPPLTSQVHSSVLLIWVHIWLLTLATKIFPHNTFPSLT